MRYRVEYQDHDRNLVTIHLDLDLRLYFSRPVKNWLVNAEDEDDFYCDRYENTPHFVKRLLLLKGIDDVTFSRYTIDIIKGDFFSWRTVISTVIKDLEVVLNHGEVAQKVRRGCYRAVPKKKVTTSG